MKVHKEEVKTLTSNSDDCEIYALIVDNKFKKFSIQLKDNGTNSYSLIYLEKIEQLRSIKYAIEDILKELSLGEKK